MANINNFNFLGKQKFYSSLEYEVKETGGNNKIGFTFSFDKRDLKRNAKAMRLSNKYFKKMEKLGFIIDNLDIDIKEVTWQEGDQK